MGWMPPAARDQACDVSPDGHLDVALMVTLIPRSPCQPGGRTGKSRTAARPGLASCAPAHRGANFFLKGSPGRRARRVLGDRDRRVERHATGARSYLRPRIMAPGSITVPPASPPSGPPQEGCWPRRSTALESMVRALAHELGPLRVNAVSPGWVDTPVWDQIASPEVKHSRLAGMAAQLPGGKDRAPGRHCQRRQLPDERQPRHQNRVPRGRNCWHSSPSSRTPGQRVARAPRAL
jgi:hypothetical protein